MSPRTWSIRRRETGELELTLRDGERQVVLVLSSLARFGLTDTVDVAFMASNRSCAEIAPNLESLWGQLQ